MKKLLLLLSLISFTVVQGSETEGRGSRRVSVSLSFRTGGDNSQRLTFQGSFRTKVQDGSENKV